VDFLKYVSSNHASEKKNALTNFALTETYIALKIYVKDSLDIELHERLKFFMWMKLYVADFILPFKVKLAEPMEFLNINCMSSFVEQWNVQLFIFLESVKSKRFLLWIQMGFLCRCLLYQLKEDFILRIISPHKFLVVGIDGCVRLQVIGYSLEY
jgi:hypothetical protein